MNTSMLYILISLKNAALAKKRFTQKLAERGIKIEKSNGNRYYSGIDLKHSLDKIMNAA
jgi:hypothetical protein